MPKTTKTRRTWLYISEDDDSRLAKLVKALGPHFNDAFVLSVLTSAALKAAEENGYQLPAKLNAVAENPRGEAMRLSEPTKASYHRK